MFLLVKSMFSQAAAEKREMQKLRERLAEVSAIRVQLRIEEQLIMRRAGTLSQREFNREMPMRQVRGW